MEGMASLGLMTEYGPEGSDEASTTLVVPAVEVHEIRTLLLAIVMELSTIVAELEPVNPTCGSVALIASEKRENPAQLYARIRYQ